LEKMLHLTMLYDFYAELLTEKQKLFFEMYYHDNFSLSEIAEEHNITPQGARDLIKRTEKLLLRYEGKLMFVDKYTRQRVKIENILLAIDNLEFEDENLIAIRAQINDIID